MLDSRVNSLLSSWTLSIMETSQIKSKSTWFSWNICEWNKM